jgi:hypothetical protein
MLCSINCIHYTTRTRTTHYLCSHSFITCIQQVHAHVVDSPTTDALSFNALCLSPDTVDNTSTPKYPVHSPSTPPVTFAVLTRTKSCTSLHADHMQPPVLLLTTEGDANVVRPMPFKRTKSCVIHSRPSRFLTHPPSSIMTRSSTTYKRPKRSLRQLPYSK